MSAFCPKQLLQQRFLPTPARSRAYFFTLPHPPPSVASCRPSARYFDLLSILSRARFDTSVDSKVKEQSFLLFINDQDTIRLPLFFSPSFSPPSFRCASSASYSTSRQLFPSKDRARSFFSDSRAISSFRERERSSPNRKTRVKLTERFPGAAIINETSRPSARSEIRYRFHDLSP